MREPRSPLDWSDPLAALGVRPFINAAGPRTIHSGASTHSRVRAAMARVSDRSVDLDELAAAASVHLARRCGIEAGLVTSGAFAALVLAAAASAYGNDPMRVTPSRRTRGARKAALIPAEHRSIYDQAYAVAGLDIIQIDTRDQLTAVASDVGAACLGLLGTRGEPEELNAWIGAARSVGMPSIVDAAAERLDAPEFWTSRGADLAVYSCGKTLRGPHAAGLLLGRADLVDAAWRHASPHHALGRGYKVGKETVVGALVAVDTYLDGYRCEAEVQWNDDLARMGEVLAASGLGCHRIDGHPRVGIPRLRVTWDARRSALDAASVYRRLDAATPRVVIRELGARGRSIEIDPSCFELDDAERVCQAIVNALDEPSSAMAHPTASTACGELRGPWRVEIETAFAPRIIDVDVDDVDLPHIGVCRADTESGRVHGRMTEERVAITCAFGEHPTLTYRLHGRGAGATYTGTALLGSSDPNDDGPDRSADQFGRVPFSMYRRSTPP